MTDVETKEAEENTLAIDAEFEELFDDETDGDFAGVILAYGYNACTSGCW